MRRNYLISLLFILFISGCATENENARREAIPSGEIEKQEMTQNQNPKQVEPSSLDQLSLRTYPEDNAFVIAAVTPRFLFNEDEVAYALASASRQISIYYGAYVSYQKLIDENVIGTIQAQKVEIIYDKDLADSFLNKLEIIEESHALDYYAALIKMKGNSLPGYPAIELMPDKKPFWINSPPDIEGFIIGVGASGRRKTVYESWEQADKLAMAEIANIISTNIYGGTANVERGGESYSASTTVNQTLISSNVHIEGLYIISRWREPDESYYYSLAIAEKP
ncbi:MAG: hypothetical protein JEY91_08920 [Spirochaetaceae bacterium]|nr:hypothetical protein [Spirochaetaceae bacterium]